MRRITICLLTYFALLPIGAGVHFVTTATPAEGLERLAAVLFVTFLISALLGVAAMTGSYVLYFVVGKSLEQSNRWMAFGVDLLCQAVVVMLLVATVRG